MKNKHITLSGIVITKNEEARIAKCLEGLSFCDEIIVVDNGSDDSTPDIAKRFNAKVRLEKQADFSTLRNIGKDTAVGEWLLYIDADEIVTESLRLEILAIIHTSGALAGYYITRENYYLGKKWPVRDKMQRLFQKSKIIEWEGKLHETAKINGLMGELQEPLIHNTHRTLEEMVDKTNIWSDYEAQLRFDTGHPRIVWWRLFRVMATGFLKSYVKEGGWKAGTHGLIESMYQAYSMFITYAKLWEMQEKRSTK